MTISSGQLTATMCMHVGSACQPFDGRRCNVALTVGRRYEVLSNALRSPSKYPSRVRGSGYEPDSGMADCQSSAQSSEGQKITRLIVKGAHARTNVITEMVIHLSVRAYTRKPENTCTELVKSA